MIRPKQIQPLLIEEFWNAVGQTRTEPIYSTVHRWRFAIPQAATYHQLLVRRRTWDRRVRRLVRWTESGRRVLEWDGDRGPNSRTD